MGRALSDAGYGVQFADVGESNDPAQVDAGIPVPMQYPEAAAGAPLMEGQPVSADSRATIARITMQGIRLQEIWCIREVRQNPAPARA